MQSAFVIPSRLLLASESLREVEGDLVAPRKCLAFFARHKSASGALPYLRKRHHHPRFSVILSRIAKTGIQRQPDRSLENFLESIARRVRDGARFR